MTYKKEQKFISGDKQNLTVTADYKNGASGDGGGAHVNA